jgi:hypothetical protein
VFLCLYLDRGQGCAWIDDEAAPKMGRSGGGFPEEVVVLRAEFGGSSPSAQNDRQKQKQKQKQKRKRKRKQKQKQKQKQKARQKAKGKSRSPFWG